MVSLSMALSCARAADSTCGEEVWRTALWSHSICCCHSLQRSLGSEGGAEDERPEDEVFEKTDLRDDELEDDREDMVRFIESSAFNWIDLLDCRNCN